MGNKFSVVEFGAITTQAGEPFDKRLKPYTMTFHMFLINISQNQWRLKIVFNTNQKTVIDVAQARGVISLCATQRNIEISEYTPLQVKQAVVGYGRAEKSKFRSLQGKF